MPRDVVVGLSADQGRRGCSRPKRRHPGWADIGDVHDVARGRAGAEGRERVADHGGDIQRAYGLISRAQERCPLVGIECVELSGAPAWGVGALSGRGQA